MSEVEEVEVYREAIAEEVGGEKYRRVVCLSPVAGILAGVLERASRSIRSPGQQ